MMAWNRFNNCHSVQKKQTSCKWATCLINCVHLIEERLVFPLEFKGMVLVIFLDPALSFESLNDFRNLGYLLSSWADDNSYDLARRKIA